MRNFFFGRKKNHDNDPGKEMAMSVFSEERGANIDCLLLKQPWLILVAILLKLYDRADPMNFFYEINKLRLVCFKFKDLHIDFFKNICQADPVCQLFFPRSLNISSFNLNSKELKSQRILLEMENFKKYERIYLCRMNGYKKLSQKNVNWLDLIFTLFDRDQFIFTGAALLVKQDKITALEIAAGLSVLHKADPSFFNYDLRHLHKYDLDVAHGILSHINYLLDKTVKESRILVFMSLLIAGDCAFLFNAYLNYQRSRKNEDEFRGYLSYYYFLAIYNDSADIVYILSTHGVDLGKILPAYYPQQLPNAVAQEIADKHMSLPEKYVTDFLNNDPVMFGICYQSERVLKYLLRSNLTISDQHIQFAKDRTPKLLSLFEEKRNAGHAVARTTRSITKTMLMK